MPVQVVIQVYTPRITDTTPMRKLTPIESVKNPAAANNHKIAVTAAQIAARGIRAGANLNTEERLWFHLHNVC